MPIGRVYSYGSRSFNMTLFASQHGGNAQPEQVSGVFLSITRGCTMVISLAGAIAAQPIERLHPFLQILVSYCLAICLFRPMIPRHFLGFGTDIPTACTNR